MYVDKYNGEKNNKTRNALKFGCPANNDYNDFIYVFQLLKEILIPTAGLRRIGIFDALIS